MWTLWTGTAVDWAPRVSKVLESGVEASKWKTEKIPPSLSPESLPPSGQEALGNLPSKHPPHRNAHKHTHTVHRSLAWRGWGQEAVWEKRGHASVSGRKSCCWEILPNQRLRDFHGSVSRSSRGLQLQKGGGCLPEKEIGGGQQRSEIQKGEIPELNVKRPFCRELSGPSYCGT